MNLIIWPIGFSLDSFGFFRQTSKSSGNVDKLFHLMLFNIISQWLEPTGQYWTTMGQEWWWQEFFVSSLL